MKVSRTVIALAFLFNPILALSIPIPVLDQFQEVDGGGIMYWDSRFVGQTFTAGLSGVLHHIEVGVGTWTGLPTYPSYVEIWDTNSSGAPGNVLGSRFFPDGFSMGWNTINFVPEHIYLESTTRYAIVFWNDDPNLGDSRNAVLVEWRRDSYTGGALWEYTSGSGWNIYTGWPREGDMQFRTYVDVIPGQIPEPSTFALFGIGIVGLAGWKIRRK
jgi:hypothetical protein